MRTWRRIAILAAGAGLALAGAAAPVPPEKMAAFLIPRLSKPPVIDGAIDPAEWREAVASGYVCVRPSTPLMPRNQV